MALTIVALVILGAALSRDARAATAMRDARARAGLRRRGRQSASIACASDLGVVDFIDVGVGELALADVQRRRHGGEHRRVPARVGAVGGGSRDRRRRESTPAHRSPAGARSRRRCRAIEATSSERIARRLRRANGRAVLGHGRRRDRARPRHQAARRAVPRAALRAAPRSSATSCASRSRTIRGAAFSMSLGAVLAVHLRRVRGHRARHSLAAVPAPTRAGRPRCASLALGLAWGGAAGNLIDRIRSRAGRRRLHRHRRRRRALLDVQRRRFRGDGRRAPARVGRCGARTATSAQRGCGRRMRGRRPSGAPSTGADRTVTRSGAGADSAGSARHELVAPTDAPRLDLFVAGALDLSRTQAATLIANGHVTRRRPRARRRATGRATGERVVVEIPPPPARAVLGRGHPAHRRLRGRRRARRRQAGGHGRASGARATGRGTLVNALKGRGGAARPRAAARSARGSSTGSTRRRPGSCSSPRRTARIACSARRLQARARSSGATRRCAWGHLDDDRITVEKPIARDPRDRKRMAIVSTGRPARTDFARLARFDSADLLRAHLHTGRTHQIRVHLASIGHPVVGDDTYGGGGGRRLVALPPRRHFLHAAWLRLSSSGHRESRSTCARRCRTICAAALVAAAGAGRRRSPTPTRWSIFGFYRRRSLTLTGRAPTLLFRVAGGVYGCDIDDVREIIPLRRATRLPGAPAFVRG